METYRYTLDRGSKKFTCPSCGKKKFGLYVDNESGNYLADIYGKCNRFQKCDYHNAPPKGKTFYNLAFITAKKISDKALKITDTTGSVHIVPISQITDLSDNDCWLSEWYLKKNSVCYLGLKSKQLYSGELLVNTVIQTDYVQPEPSYHSLALLDSRVSFPDYFTKYLRKIFTPDQVNEAKKLYLITGTDKPWNGATVFWQIDDKERVHAGKIMLYDEHTGKREKRPGTHPQWMHSIRKETDFKLNQCLFGLHRTVEDNYKTIAITESEKTAVIMSIILPDYIWMACGGAGKLGEKLLRPIKHRKIIYFPDKGLYAESLSAASTLNNDGYSVTISEIIESLDVQNGADLADVYLSELHELNSS